MTGCATLGREKRVNLIDKHRWRSNLTIFSFSQLLNYYSLSRRLLSLSPSLPPDIESNQFLVRRICFAELPAANRWSASTNEQSFQSRLTRFKKRANERTIARTKKRSSLGGEADGSALNWNRESSGTRERERERSKEWYNNPFRSCDCDRFASFRGIGRFERSKGRNAFPSMFNERGINHERGGRWISFQPVSNCPMIYATNIERPCSPRATIYSLGKVFLRGRVNSWAGLAPTQDFARASLITRVEGAGERGERASSPPRVKN